MSIATQLQAYEDGLSDAYDMVAQRGGTIPAQKNMANLDTAIATIPSGGGSPTTPTITNATYSNGVIAITGTDFGSSPTIKMYNRKYSRYDDITPTASTSTTATVSVGTSDYGYYSRVVKVENGGFESNPKFVYADFENLGANGYEVILWVLSKSPNGRPYRAFGATVANCCTIRPQSTSTTAPTASATTATEIGGIGDYAMQCAIMGAEIKPTVTSIDTGGSNSFLGGCLAFEQPIGLANVTSINGTTGSGAGGFLGTAISFNNIIDLNNVTTIGAGFLTHCYAYNQPLDLSRVTTLWGRNFLNCCLSYNKPLALPVGTSQNPIHIGQNFMKNCYAMSYPITLDYYDFDTATFTNAFQNTLNLPALNITNMTFNATSYPNNVLSVQSSGGTCPAFVDGITINGDSTAATFMTKFPNLQTSSASRKLIQGTITS